MNNTQVHSEITIIREMIEKTRQETAQSGYLLIFIGIFSALAALCIGVIQLYNISGWTIPVLILTTVVNAIAGYIIATKEEQNAKVESYTKIIFWNVWMICGIAAVLLVFLFPYLNIYPFQSVPVLVSLLMGIALFITGIVFELKSIQWISLIWWVGAVLMSILRTPYTFLIMVAVIILGWVLPGFMLHKEYKKKG